MFRKIVITFIRVYQFTLSKLLKRCCRFYPSCSEYTIQAIDKHGVPRGVFLGIIRVFKCNPLFPGGYDPVS